MLVMNEIFMFREIFVNTAFGGPDPENTRQVFVQRPNIVALDRHVMLEALGVSFKLIQAAAPCPDPQLARTGLVDGYDFLVAQTEGIVIIVPEVCELLAFPIKTGKASVFSTDPDDAA